MLASVWSPVTQDGANGSGFIAIDEHTHRGCVISEVSDLGARLVMLDARPVPDEFILYTDFFSKAQPCKAIWRTDEVIGAWFDGAAY